MQRALRVVGPAAILGAGLVALIASLAFGGGADAPALVDPGAVARWGLPIAKLVVNLSIGLTVGALLLALFALSRGRPEYDTALDVAAAGGGVWAVSSAASAYFAYATVASRLPGLDAAEGEAIGRFVTQVSIGQAWLAMTLIGAAVTVLCFAVRNQWAIIGVLALAVAGLVRLANEGHSGDSSTHDVASTAILLHMAFAGAWLGGLLTLVLLRRRLDERRLPVVLARYSTVALVCFVVVAWSGYLSAAIRVGDLPSLLTPYGVLVLVKIAVLLALGLFGAAQRRVVIRRIAAAGERRVAPWFWTLVVAELAFMGIASGVAAALARTATPVADLGTGDLAAPTPAEILIDKPLPPEFTPDRWFTEWNLDPLWSTVCAFALFFYWAGVWRLLRRGDSWPWYRGVLWTIGILLFGWVTNGPINVYENVLFSVHMLGHMLLSMAVPLLLVLSAPVTLAMRAIHRRDDGSRGAREWILLAVNSRPAVLLTNPLIAAGIFVASLWAFYYTPLVRWAVEDHLGHMWMVVHFVISGYLFASALIGVDPGPHRPPYPVRMIILFATMALHAFFGLSLVTGEGLLLADWYGAMGRTWGPTPLEDQRIGGGVTWSVGELPTLSLAILVALQWSRSDAREAKRIDRKADRDGDAELAEYNRMLAQRAERD